MARHHVLSSMSDRMTDKTNGAKTCRQDVAPGHVIHPLCGQKTLHEKRKPRARAPVSVTDPIYRVRLQLAQTFNVDAQVLDYPFLQPIGLVDYKSLKKSICRDTNSKLTLASPRPNPSNPNPDP